MVYVLFFYCYEENPIIIGVYSTREKADEDKNKVSTSSLFENCGNFYLHKKELDSIINISDMDSQCIYQMEKREIRKKKEEEARNIRIEDEKQKKTYLKKRCENIIKIFDEDIMAKQGISGLVSQFNICCSHMEKDTSYDFYPQIMCIGWSELCKSGIYLSSSEIDVFVEFFKLFGISFSCGHK